MKKLTRAEIIKMLEGVGVWSDPCGECGQLVEDKARLLATPDDLPVICADCEGKML